MARLFMSPVNIPSIQSAITEADEQWHHYWFLRQIFWEYQFSWKAITVSSLDPNDPNTVGTTIIDGNQPADVNKGSVVTFNGGERQQFRSERLYNHRRQRYMAANCLGPLRKFTGIAVAAGQSAINMSGADHQQNIFINNIAGERWRNLCLWDSVNPTSPSNPLGTYKTADYRITLSRIIQPS